jgi:flagellar biosynthesis chaperone FliJ
MPHGHRKQKEGKAKGHSSTKYVSSDDDISSDEAFDLGKNPTTKLGGLMKQINLRDELLEQQEMLLVQERESNSELKKLLALEKKKNEKLAQELAKSKETTTSLESSIDALQETHDTLQNIHKDLEVQFNALWSSSSSNPSSDLDRAKASTSNGCDRCYNIDINALCAQVQHSNVEQIFVESCDKAIDKENNHLKLKVKKLEQKVSMLEKKVKVQPSQDKKYGE